jgi:hypothetical protein
MTAFCLLQYTVNQTNNRYTSPLTHLHQLLFHHCFLLQYTIVSLHNQYTKPLTHLHQLLQGEAAISIQQGAALDLQQRGPRPLCQLLPYGCNGALVRDAVDFDFDQCVVLEQG